MGCDMVETGPRRTLMDVKVRERAVRIAAWQVDRESIPALQAMRQSDNGAKFSYAVGKFIGQRLTRRRRVVCGPKGPPHDQFKIGEFRAPNSTQQHPTILLDFHRHAEQNRLPG